jgi:CRISPR system Cascade subunit CasC
MILEDQVMAHVVVHRIFSLSVSLPVRGADGLAKRAPYGGVERQRLSSQSVKSHLRSATGIPGSMADLAAALGTEMSVRSALIGPRLIAPELEKRGLSAEEASDWAGAVMALFQTGKKAPPAEAASPKKGKKAKTDAEADDAKEDDADEAVAASLPGRQVLTLGKQEIDALTTVAETLQKERIAPSEMRDLVEKPTKRKKFSENVRNALAALDGMRAHAGLDGALFGRMATGIALSRVDSAVHVGHALTTHAIQSSVDFFSAQDQLLDRDAGEETGGAHIGSRELTTGVYYLPVVIDVEQIRSNCSGWTNDEIAKVLGWLVKSIATITPAAMLGSTAPFTDPGEVVVEITNWQPVNAMGAFERPVVPTLEASVAAFNHHIERVWAMIGHPAKVARLSDFIDPKASLPAVQRLADSVADAIRATGPAPK